MRMRDFLKEVGGSASDLFNLPVAALDPNPDNIRLDTQDLREHIQTIADSILAAGFLRSRPLTVRLVGDRAIVVDGNCRFAAVKLAMAQGAEILTVPCVPEAQGTTESERISNMVIANSGMAHSPLEMTAAVKKLISFGWEPAQIAKKWGKSRQYVDNLLDLAGASPDVHLAITNGTVSATQAIRLIRSEGDNAGAVIAAVAEKARAEGKARVTARAFRVVAPEAVKIQAPKQAARRHDDFADAVAALLSKIEPVMEDAEADIADAYHKVAAMLADIEQSREVA